MATHSSTLAWKIPRTEEPGRLQSMGSQRVWHDWATSLCNNSNNRPSLIEAPPAFKSCLNKYMGDSVLHSTFPISTLVKCLRTYQREFSEASQLSQVLWRCIFTFARSGLALQPNVGLQAIVAPQVPEWVTRYEIWCNGSGDLQPLLDWCAESTLRPAFIPDCRLQNSFWSVFPKTPHWHSPDPLVSTPGCSLLGKSQEHSASM